MRSILGGVRIGMGLVFVVGVAIAAPTPQIAPQPKPLQPAAEIKPRLKEASLNGMAPYRYGAVSFQFDMISAAFKAIDITRASSPNGSGLKFRAFPLPQTTIGERKPDGTTTVNVMGNVIGNPSASTRPIAIDVTFRGVRPDGTFSELSTASVNVTITADRHVQLTDTAKLWDYAQPGGSGGCTVLNRQNEDLGPVATGGVIVKNNKLVFRARGGAIGSDCGFGMFGMPSPSPGNRLLPDGTVIDDVRWRVEKTSGKCCMSADGAQCSSAVNPPPLVGYQLRTYATRIEDGLAQAQWALLSNEKQIMRNGIIFMDNPTERFKTILMPATARLGCDKGTSGADKIDLILEELSAFVPPGTKLPWENDNPPPPNPLLGWEDPLCDAVCSGVPGGVPNGWSFPPPRDGVLKFVDQWQGQCEQKRGANEAGTGVCKLNTVCSNAAQRVQVGGVWKCPGTFKASK